MNLIGALCVGLVWGWLAHGLHRPATRRWTLAILLAVTAAAALELWWQLDLTATFQFTIGALFGAMGFGAWIEGLARRRRLEP